MTPAWREFGHWRAGVEYALDGGLWLHRFTLHGVRWAHLVSADRELLLEAGERLNLDFRRLQYRPLRDPRTLERVAAWHWDLRGERLARAVALAGPRVPFGARPGPH